MNVARVPYCRCCGRMSGVVGQKFGRKNSAATGSSSDVMYVTSSCLVVRHVKYVYDCEKPALARAFMSFGRVKASARKITSGCFCRIDARHQRQNGRGLV